MSTFLAIKSLIVGAQKVITYRWKGNRITHAMGTINHHHLKYFIIQNGKNEILEKSNAGNIADNTLSQEIRLKTRGHLPSEHTDFYYDLPPKKENVFLFVCCCC